MSESKESENIRRSMCQELGLKANATPEQEYYTELLKEHGADGVFTTQELQEKFDVLGFAALFVIARRKSDGQRGSLTFAHRPRYYFGWKAE